MGGLQALLRSISNPCEKDDSGNRKNYGLTSLNAHVKECRKRLRTVPSVTSTAVAAKESASIQTLTPRFAYNKNRLSEHLQAQMKDAELKFVTGGSHSFNALENDGLPDLVQTAIDIGAQVGKVNVRDIFLWAKNNSKRGDGKENISPTRTGGQFAWSRSKAKDVTSLTYSRMSTSFRSHLTFDVRPWRKEIFAW
jgi:hypothetical protein